jgi:hypothetical protein
MLSLGAKVVLSAWLCSASQPIDLTAWSVVTGEAHRPMRAHDQGQHRIPCVRKELMDRKPRPECIGLVRLCFDGIPTHCSNLESSPLFDFLPATLPFQILDGFAGPRTS